jgi:hypothetical protein
MTEQIKEPVSAWTNLPLEFFVGKAGKELSCATDV